MIGLTQVIDGSFGAGLMRYRDAVSLFGGSGEVWNRARLQNLIAEVYDLMGEPHLAWRERLPMLRLASRAEDGELAHGVYGAAVRALLITHLPEAALHFQNAVVAAMKLWGPPSVQTEAFLERAQIEGQLGKRTQALDDLRRSDELLQKIASPEIAWPFEADLAVERARLTLGSDPDHAVQDLKRALASAGKVGETFRLPELRLAEANAYLASHDRAAARRSLLDGIGRLERDRPPASPVSQASVPEQFLESLRRVDRP